MNTSQELRRLFESEAIYREEYWHSFQGRAIREIVFGINDGVVSTVCFIAGMSGALFDHRVILISGIAEVCAGAISMCFGGYLSTKNQREFFEKEIDRERYEIEEMPEKEREEIRKIYSAKGFQGPELEAVVKQITSDKNVWLKTMMEEELGLIFESMDNPFKVGFVIGLSFIVGGMIPLVPFLFTVDPVLALRFSLGLSGVGLFIVGAAKISLTSKNWILSGLESFLIGFVATVAGFIIGKFAGFLVSQSGFSLA